MSPARDRRVTIVGDGVVGLAVALVLARAGWRVQVVGEGRGRSASAVAAGMLAPASEALLDHLGAEDAAALLHARARWNAWAAELRLPLDAAGALHLAPPAELAARAVAAARLGIEAERRGDTLRLPQDARIDPPTALSRLAQAARAAGAVLRRGRVQARDGRLELDGAAVAGEVVIAAGWGSAALTGAAPELAALLPIRGQLLHIAGPAASGPTVRAPGAYLAPGLRGWTVGATMEPGRSDLVRDPAATRRLRAAAVAVRPELAVGAARTQVGVRAATADGRPLAGRSRTGAWIATGLRRNGWLLAPLVAEGMAAYLAGHDPDAVLAGQARAWDPARVLPPDLAKERWA